DFLAARTLTVEAGGEPLWPQIFDPLNVQRLSPSYVLHARSLTVGNAAGKLDLFGRAAITEAAGAHSGFQGIRRAVGNRLAGGLGIYTCFWEWTGDDLGGVVVPGDLFPGPAHPLGLRLAPVRDGVPVLQVQGQLAGAEGPLRNRAARHHPAAGLQRVVRGRAPHRRGRAHRLPARSARDPGARRLDRRDPGHRPRQGGTAAARWN